MWHPIRPQNGASPGRTSSFCQDPAGPQRCSRPRPGRAGLGSRPCPDGAQVCRTRSRGLGPELHGAPSSGGRCTLEAHIPKPPADIGRAAAQPRRGQPAQQSRLARTAEEGSSPEGTTPVTNSSVRAPRGTRPHRSCGPASTTTTHAEPPTTAPLSPIRVLMWDPPHGLARHASAEMPSGFESIRDRRSVHHLS